VHVRFEGSILIAGYPAWATVPIAAVTDPAPECTQAGATGARHPHGVPSLLDIRRAACFGGLEEWLPSTGNWGNFCEQFHLAGRRAPSASQERDGEKARAIRVPALQRACAFRRLLDSGEAENRAEIARRYGISRASVTQIMNLLKLPEEILDHIARLPEKEQLRSSERLLRAVVALDSKGAQLKALGQFRSART